MLTLHNDPEFLDWVLNLELMHAGSFLLAIGEAAGRADPSNYWLMRPLLMALKNKYPEYGGRKDEIGRSA